MKPEKIKSIRQALGLSQQELAERLRLSDSRVVRRWEAGTRSVSGPTEIALEYILREELGEKRARELLKSG